MTIFIKRTSQGKGYGTKSMIKALQKLIVEQFEEYQKYNKKINIDLVNNIKTYSMISVDYIVC